MRNLSARTRIVAVALAGVLPFLSMVLSDRAVADDVGVTSPQTGGEVLGESGVGESDGPGRSGVLGPKESAVQSPQSNTRSDYEKVREARKKGLLMPYARLLRKVQKSHPGDVVNVRLLLVKGVWLYEFKFLNDSGTLEYASVDARTATILRTWKR